jgi:hypothetical protein
LDCEVEVRGKPGFIEPLFDCDAAGGGRRRRRAGPQKLFFHDLKIELYQQNSSENNLPKGIETTQDVEGVTVYQ